MLGLFVVSTTDYRYFCTYIDIVIRYYTVMLNEHGPSMRLT